MELVQARAGIDGTAAFSRHQRSCSHLRFVAEVNQIGHLSKILMLSDRARNRDYRPGCRNCQPQMHMATTKHCDGNVCDCGSLARMMLAAGSDLSLMEYWSTKFLHPCERDDDGMLNILWRTSSVTFVIKRRIYDDYVPLQSFLRSSKIGRLTSARMIENGVGSLQRFEERGEGCSLIGASGVTAKFDLRKRFKPSPNPDAKPTTNHQSHSVLATTVATVKYFTSGRRTKSSISRPIQPTKKTMDRRKSNPILRMTLLYGTSNVLPYVLELMLKGVVHLTDEALLDLALINCDPSIMQYLLYEGICDVNQKDDYGYTALHKLVDPRLRYANLLLKIQTLLNSGADINAKTKTGQTILGLAARRHDHYTDVFECLIKNIALLQKKGRHIDCDIWFAISTSPKFDTFYNKCRAELELLQNSHIDGSISLYSILMRENIVASVKSRRVMHRFTHVDWYSISLGRRFPIYYSLLKANFFEMKSRVDLIDNAISGLERILMLNSDTFYHIYDQVLSSLQYEDLISLYRISRLWYLRMRENPLFQQARARDGISIQSKALLNSIVLRQNF